MYHINPETGVPSLCRAIKGKCPYGGASGRSNHFDTFSEAQSYSQEIFAQKYNVLPTSAGGEYLGIIEEKRRAKAEKVGRLMNMGKHNKLKTLSETEDMDLLMGVIDGEIEGDGWMLTGAALQNINLPRQYLEDMVIDYPDEFEDEARKWAASNKSLTHDDLVHIFENDENEDVRAVALLNENLSREYVNKVIAGKSKGELVNKPYSVVFADWKNTELEEVNRAKAILKDDKDFIDKQLDARRIISGYINVDDRKHLVVRG